MTRFLPLRKLLLLSAGILLAAVPAYAQEGGGTRSQAVGRPPDKEEAFEVGRYVFVGIGIDEYARPRLWTPLDNAVNDVEGVREMLVENFGFESPEEWFLTDEEATRDNIQDLIDDLYTLAPEDNLVFFFAGHGISADIRVGNEAEKQAFIVPVDAEEYPETRAATRQYLQITDILEDLADLDARHVVAIFDACDTGVALDEESGMKTRGRGTNFTEPDVLMRRFSRYVITSATEEQKAKDDNPDYPGNSLFTGWLLEGLRRASAGETAAEESPAGEDGSLTITELAQFVQTEVQRVATDHPVRGQTPAFGTFEFDQQGELVIELEVDPFMELYRQAEEAYDEDKMESLNSAADSALTLRDAGPYVSHLRYMRANLNGEDGPALVALRELDAFRAAGRDIPMSQGQLGRRLRDKEKICRSGACDLGGGL